MATTRVFTPSEALEAITKSPNAMVCETKPKAKRYEGSMFFDVKWNIAGSTKADGWFSLRNIPLVGMRDPAESKDTKKPNDKKPTTAGLSMLLSKTGDWGKFMIAVNDRWAAEVARLQKLSVAEGGLDPEKKALPCVSFNYSRKNTDPEKAGKAFDDPYINFKISPEERYPMKHPIPALRGALKTAIYDYETRKVGPDGLVTYELATVEENGVKQPITLQNVHKFITEGSILKHGRIFCNSGCESNFGISLQMTGTYLVIQKGTGGGAFEDDEYDHEQAAAASSIADGIDDLDIENM